MSYGDLNCLGSNKAIFYFDRGIRGKQIFNNSMYPLKEQPKYKDIVVIEDIVFTSPCKCDSSNQHKEMFPHYRWKDTDLFEKLKELGSDYSHKFTLGDLNVELLLAADVNAYTIRTPDKNLNLKVVQHGPTHRHILISYTWIYLILLEENDEALDYKNECLPSFGKRAIFYVTINIFAPAPVRGYRDYKNISASTLNELVARCDRMGMNSIESDLEGALYNLNSNLNLTMS